MSYTFYMYESLYHDNSQIARLEKQQYMVQPKQFLLLKIILYLHKSLHSNEIS